jgi:hemerythrin-like domain-containing protein
MGLLGRPAPGFNEPLALLRACHERIAERLDLLARLPDHVAAHGADPEAQAAARRILQYFDRAAPHHHQDEEEDLFPMLRDAQERPGADPRLSGWLEQLLQEHCELDAGWKALRPHLVALTEGQQGADLACPALIETYRRHMALENEHLFPLADRLLSVVEIVRLSAAMQVRRGITPC